VQGIRGQCDSKVMLMSGGTSGFRWARTFVRRAPKHNSLFVSCSSTMTSLFSSSVPPQTQSTTIHEPDVRVSTCQINDVWGGRATGRVRRE